jgi:hypothetical protein
VLGAAGRSVVGADRRRARRQRAGRLRGAGRWIDDQAEQRRHSDDEGLDAEQVAALREPAGRADEKRAPSPKSA